MYATDPHVGSWFVFFLMIRRPPRSTLDRSSAASDVYKRQGQPGPAPDGAEKVVDGEVEVRVALDIGHLPAVDLSLIHISEPTRPY